MRTTLPPHHPPRPQVLATLVATLGALGCGADGGAELSDSDGAALGSLAQAFGEPTCATTKADDVLKPDVTYITPAEYDHPECRHSVVLDAPDLVFKDSIVNVSWSDPKPVGEKSCSSQLLQASFLAEYPILPGDRYEIGHAASKGEWLNGTCVIAPLRFDYCPDGVFADCIRVEHARIVVSGTINVPKAAFIPTRAVSVTSRSKERPLTPLLTKPGG